MVNDGRFYGSNSDLALDEGTPEQVVIDGALALAVADPAVERVGELIIAEITVDELQVTSLAFSGGAQGEPVAPTIAAGRAPVAADEIASGLTTMRELDVGIGDSVALAADGFDGVAQVVGRVVLATIGLYSGPDRTSIGGLVSRNALGPRAEATKSFIDVDLGAAG